MAQINLLKQKTSSQNFWEFFPSLMVKILFLVVLAVIGYYVWLYLQIRSTENSIAEEKQASSLAGQGVKDVANRDEIYTRQAQLQQLDGLISKHLYWSYIFPALAKVTLKQAGYSSITVTSAGQISLSVTVADFDSIDKFIQVFDQPEFSQNFNNLKVGAFHKEGDNAGYAFDAVLNFNKAIMNYQEPGTNKTQ